ncbi:streptophobe family protein [Streptomyces sp. NPDC046977]|uniref:streptophobe family protein n=1 Tax=Streptomyces sp. NPDC046977 TaxID=3154703 RepID=UPI0033D1AA8C
MTTYTSTPPSAAPRQPPRPIPWGSVLLSAIAAVSWAYLAMVGVAALGLHLLGADTAGSLGPMTAAVVAMAVGGKVSPSGDVAVFGLDGAGAAGAIDIMPLGVGLVGALLLAWVFLRSLRGAGVTVPAGELLARAGTVAVLFVVLLGVLGWAGEDTIAIDGAALGAGKGSGGGGGLIDQLPGIGDIGGGLGDGLKDLIDAKASVSFHVDTGRSLLGGLLWVLAVLLLSLLASRRTPLPPGMEAVHTVVRPAASALRWVLLLAVVAGCAAAGYAAATEDDPKRIAGAALLGAPNGVWLAVPLGLFVPWKGTATGELAKVLPDPLDRLLTGGAQEPVTMGRLAELDHRVWLLTVAVALMMLAAGALAAARTPLRGLSRAGYAGRCALSLGAVTALAFPLLVLLTGVSVDAGLSVFGFDAVGAGIDLHGSMPLALLLGAAWGAAAGGAGALLALATGTAGRRVSPYVSAGPTNPTGPTGHSPAGAHPVPARPAAPAPTGPHDSGRTYPGIAYEPGPYLPSPGYQPHEEQPNPYKESPPSDAPHSARTVTGMPLPPPPGPPPGRAPGPPPHNPPPPGAPGQRR